MSTTQPRPVMNAFRWIQAISAVVGPGLALLVKFDVLVLTADELADLIAFIGILVVAIAQGLGVHSESLVTPTANPRGADLTPLVPANTDPVI